MKQVTTLRAIRNLWKLSAVKVSKYIGCTDSWIYCIETGEHVTSSRTQKKLSGFYGLPIEQLFHPDGVARLMQPGQELPSKPATPPKEKPVVQQPVVNTPVVEPPKVKCASCSTGDTWICKSCYAQAYKQIRDLQARKPGLHIQQLERERDMLRDSLETAKEASGQQADGYRTELQQAIKAIHDRDVKIQQLKDHIIEGVLSDRAL